jgi:hypothetical protein
VSCHPWGRQHTTNGVALCDDLQYMPTHFMEGHKTWSKTFAWFMPHLSDYDHKKSQLTVCEDAIKIPYSSMIRFEKMSVFNLSSQINTSNSNSWPANQSTRQPFNELTPWSRILAENLLVPPLVRRSPVVYETWHKICEFITACNLPYPETDKSSLQSPIWLP